MIWRALGVRFTDVNFRFLNTDRLAPDDLHRLITSMFQTPVSDKAAAREVIASLPGGYDASQ